MKYNNQSLLSAEKFNKLFDHSRQTVDIEGDIIEAFKFVTKKRTLTQ